jgi:hypothetical protein
MPLGMTSPACAVGSGKFATPCARMHWEYWSSGPPPAAPDGGLEEPQAVIAAAEITTANWVSNHREFSAPRALGVRVSLAASSFISWPEFYGLAYNAGETDAVTPLLHGVRDPRSRCRER